VHHHVVFEVGGAVEPLAADVALEVFTAGVSQQVPRQGRAEGVPLTTDVALVDDSFLILIIVVALVVLQLPPALEIFTARVAQERFVRIVDLVVHIETVLADETLATKLAGI
jgi:hypothetical protein